MQSSFTAGCSSAGKTSVVNTTTSNTLASTPHNFNVNSNKSNNINSTNTCTSIEFSNQPSINSFISNSSNQGSYASSISSVILTASSSTNSSNINTYCESLRNNAITLLEHIKIPATSDYTISTSKLNCLSASSTYGCQQSYGVYSSLITPSPLVTPSITSSNTSANVPIYSAPLHAAPHQCCLPLSLPQLPQQLQPPQPPQPPLPPSSPAPPRPPPSPPIPPIPTLRQYTYTAQHDARYSHTEPLDSYITKLQSLCVPSDIYTYSDDGKHPAYDTVKTNLHQDYPLMPTII